MNGKDIFLGLKYVGEDLIEEAEYGSFPKRSAKPAEAGNTRRGLRRPFLLAAVIALMLLLGNVIFFLLDKLLERKIIK